ncbi:MAG: C_GCAxxG_C_C family protein, partial [Bacteroidales bacterium]|nr:C_GCAxxG_C_C family protein [Bacteroidales bacterium]
MMVFDIEERVAKAKRLFKEDGYNCCQAVVLAYNDLFGIDDKLAAALSSGFGGGMGRMREVCGSVSGMVMLAGLMAPADNP